MSAEGIVLIITALSVQLLAPLLAHLKMQKTVGSPNGLGTVHEALKTVVTKVDALAECVHGIDERVGRLEERN